nr:autophagy protein 2 B [Hymenolepis microstoma]
MILAIFDPNSPLQPAFQLRSSRTKFTLKSIPCHLELDPTLADRLHRTFDALKASSVFCKIIRRNIDEASGLRLTVEDDGAKVRKWLNEDRDSNGGENSEKDLGREENQAKFTGPPQIEISCLHLLATVYIPIPIESVPSLYGENLSMMRERLVMAGNSNPLPWWKPNHRSESLILDCRNISAVLGDAQSLNPLNSTCSVEFGRIGVSFGGGGSCDGVEFLTIGDTLDRASSRVTLHITPGVASDQCSPEENRSSSLDSVEEELFRRVTPRGGARCPFIRATGVVDANMREFCDKDPLAPGDFEHLKKYRSGARKNASLSIEADISVVQFHPPNERVIHLIHSRLLTDLALWRSLLPENMKTRSRLQVGGGINAPFNPLDHRFWFFTESVEENPNLVHGSSCSPTPDQFDGQETTVSNSKFVSLSVKTFIIPIPLAICQNLTGASSSTAVLSAHSFLMTTEINPQNLQDLFYITLTADDIVLNVSESFNQQLETGEVTRKDIDFSLLLPMKLPSQSDGPMLSLVLEKQSVPVYGPLEPLDPGITEYLTIGCLLRRGLVCYLPFIDSWFNGLPQLQTDYLSIDYPSLMNPEYVFQTYVYLESCAIQAPPVCAFKFMEKKSEMLKLGPGLDTLRPMIFTYRATLITKTRPLTMYFGTRKKTKLVLIPPSLNDEIQTSPMTFDQVLLQSLLKESQEVNRLFCDKFPSDCVRVMKVNSLQICFVRKEPLGEAPCVDIRMTLDNLQVDCCIDSLVALQLLVDNFSDKTKPRNPKRASSMPLLRNYSHVDEIADQLSSAMSDVNVADCAPQATDVKVIEKHGGFMYVDKHSDSSERKPLKVLEDGTRIMLYTPPVDFDPNFYSVDQKVLEESSSRKGLFMDPPGSETSFAFTLYDSSIVVRICVGLDFPILSANTDLRECFNQVKQPLITHRVKEGVALKLSDIYFRNSTFEPPDNMPVGPYSSFKELKRSHNQSPMVTRYILQVGHFRIADELKDSRARHLLYVPKSTRVFRNGKCVEALHFRVLLWPSVHMLDFEAEAKASIQPLNVVLDQVMLNYLRGYHECFNKLSEIAFERVEHYVPLLLSPFTDLYGFESELSGGEFLEDDDQRIFIRKFTLSPSLPIHFDYHGHRLDMSQGALIGLLAMCLQLKNAELVLPKKVYQRGFRGVSSLVEAVTGDWMAILKENLPQMVVKNFGPMHEISNITAAIRDFGAHVVNAFREPIESSLTGRRMRQGCGRHAKLISRESADHVVRGLRRGVRALSDNAVWPLIGLSSQGLHITQCIVETVFDILSPGPSVRTRHLSQTHPSRSSFGKDTRRHSIYSCLESSPSSSSTSVREPQNVMEGMTRAAEAVRQRVVNLATDLSYPILVPDPNKGSVGAIGDVLRQIPAVPLAPVVMTLQAGNNLLDGIKNQYHPEAKLEEEEKWKN